MQQLRGTGVALVTPFKSDSTIDYKALEKLVAYVSQDNGVEFLVVLGTTSEVPNLDQQEKRDVLAAIKKYNVKKLPIVIGIGGNNTKLVCKEILSYDLDGVDAILSVSPYYNKPSQEGIFKHFEELNAVTPKPIIVYNVPGRTQSNISPSTTIRMANELNNIVGIKEACNDISQYIDVLRNKPKEFMFWSGDDDLALLSAYAGGDGVISVIGQGLPVVFSEMIRKGLQGDVTANTTNNILMDLIQLIFKEGNPAGIKSVLEQKGILENHTRLPLMTASEELQKEIEIQIKRINDTV